MEEHDEYTLGVSLSGQPLGRVKKVYTGTCHVDGPIPDWLNEAWAEGEARRKAMERVWTHMPDTDKCAAKESACLLGSLLYKLHAHGLSFDVMAEGKPHTLTITLNKS